MGKPGLGHREERKAREEPDAREDGHRLPPGSPGPHPRLPEPRDDGLRQERAPGEEAQQEHRDVEERRPARPGHGPEHAAEGLAPGARGVVPAVEPEHGGVPRSGDQQEEPQPAEGPRLPPRLREAACDQEVGDHPAERDQESHRPLGERRETGGDPGERVPEAARRRAPPAPEERVARDGRPERERRVGERHPADRDVLDGEEQHQRGAPGHVPPEDPAGEGVLDQHEEERRDGRREARRRLAHSQDRVRRSREPVDERGLGEARRPAEGRRDPGARLQHLAGRLGVGAFVTVRECHGSQADEEEEPREREEKQGVPGRAHGLDCTRES